MVRWTLLAAFWVTGALVLMALMSPGPAEAQLFQPKATVTSPEGKSIEEAQQEAYDGPKARIAVARFTDKTGKGWWTGAIGDGMADMLATALFHTNRYILLERQALGDVIKEQDLGTAGRIKKGTEAAVGEIEGAELIVVGAVTEFEGAASGGGGGIGGIGGGAFGTATRILGGIAGGIKNAHMAIDMRIIDTKTSRVVAATSVEGKATDFSLGGALAGAGGGGALGGALGGWSKTPTEKALRICIQEAIKFVVSKTPQSYYRVKPAGAVVAAAPAAAAPAAAPAAVAAAPAAGAVPPAGKALQTIRADKDQNLIADLTEVKLRGSVLSVVVALRTAAPQAAIAVHSGGSKVLDYNSGKSFEVISVDGFSSGVVASGESKTLRATFKAPPKGAKIAITLNGLGTFDDVEVGQ